MAVDERMRSNPDRWHLEGLAPVYEDTVAAELRKVLEELELKGD